MIFWYSIKLNPAIKICRHKGVLVYLIIPFINSQQCIVDDERLTLEKFLHLRFFQQSEQETVMWPLVNEERLLRYPSSIPNCRDDNWRSCRRKRSNFPIKRAGLWNFFLNLCCESTHLQLSSNFIYPKHFDIVNNFKRYSLKKFHDAPGRPEPTGSMRR